MTVKELKKLIPLADAYELKADGKYFITTTKRIDRKQMETIRAAWAEMFKQHGIVLFVGDVEVGIDEVSQ